jgi:F420H(2)-dependent quinone reductase
MTSPSIDRPSTTSSPWLPPRWVIRTIWMGHRAVHRFTGGRRGLAVPKPGGQFGYLKLTTIGRKSGKQRAAILGYVEDAAGLVTLAMNGWADADPAWWLNLQSHPDAIVELKSGARPVRARAAQGTERERLLARLREHTGYGDIDAFTARRAGQTAVVVLEPRPEAAAVARS